VLLQGRKERRGSTLGESQMEKLQLQQLDEGPLKEHREALISGGPDFHEVVDLLCDSDEEMPPVVDAEEFLLGAVNEKVLCQAGVCHPRRRHAG